MFQTLSIVLGKFLINQSVEFQLKNFKGILSTQITCRISIMNMNSENNMNLCKIGNIYNTRCKTTFKLFSMYFRSQIILNVFLFYSILNWFFISINKLEYHSSPHLVLISQSQIPKMNTASLPNLKVNKVNLVHLDFIALNKF